tara:strand:+ start:1062 stop:2075 length:1014 start_codon:yes stop_codon:yes gene_type:complete
MARKKNKKKKGGKKKRSNRNIDFSNLNINLNLNLDFGTRRGGGSFFDDKIESLETLSSRSFGNSSKERLRRLISAKKGGPSYVDKNIVNINRLTYKVVRGLETKPGQFEYKDGKPVAGGVPYHVHFTTKFKKYYMTLSRHNVVTSKLIFRINPTDDYTTYSNLAQPQLLSIKPTFISPSQVDYEAGYIDRAFARLGNQINKPPFEISLNQIDSSPLYVYVNFRFLISGNRTKVRYFNNSSLNKAANTIPNIKKYVNPFQFYKPGVEMSERENVLSQLKLNVVQSVGSTTQQTTTPLQQTTTTTTGASTPTAGYNAGSGGPPSGAGGGGSMGSGGGGY